MSITLWHTNMNFNLLALKTTFCDNKISDRQTWILTDIRHKSVRQRLTHLKTTVCSVALTRIKPDSDARKVLPLFAAAFGKVPSAIWFSVLAKQWQTKELTVQERTKQNETQKTTTIIPFTPPAPSDAQSSRLRYHLPDEHTYLTTKLHKQQDSCVNTHQGSWVDAENASPP